MAKARAVVCVQVKQHTAQKFSGVALAAAARMGNAMGLQCRFPSRW